MSLGELQQAIDLSIVLIYACGLLEHRRQLQAFPYRLVAVESSENFAKDVFDDFPNVDFFFLPRY